MPIGSGADGLMKEFEEMYRAEIAQQIRQVITDGVSTNNPILAYCPTAKFTF